LKKINSFKILKLENPISGTQKCAIKRIMLNDKANKYIFET